VAILDLSTHPFAFVTVNELAKYWRVTSGLVREAIEAGELEAITFRGGKWRITTRAAIAFEQKARVKGTEWPRVVPFQEGRKSRRQTP
jgi:excisionase family DNA binding protein